LIEKWIRSKRTIVSEIELPEKRREDRGFANYQCGEFLSAGVVANWVFQAALPLQ
jgi:hypothetical protein